MVLVTSRRASLASLSFAGSAVVAAAATGSPVGTSSFPKGHIKIGKEYARDNKTVHG